MSDKLTAIRLKQADGTYSDQIPIWTTADNVAYNNNYTLRGVIGAVSVATDGSIASQLETLVTDYASLRAAIGTPLVATSASAMTDHDKIYVYVRSPAETGYTNGNWYYWNSSTSTWTSGGTYQSMGVQTDTTLTNAGMAADAQATGKIIVINGTSATSTRVNITTTDTDVELAEMSDVNDLKNTLIIANGGATVDRPQSYQTYGIYFDTTLNRPVWWTGNRWVDAVGTSV